MTFGLRSKASHCPVEFCFYLCREDGRNLGYGEKLQLKLNISLTINYNFYVDSEVIYFIKYPLLIQRPKPGRCLARVDGTHRKSCVSCSLRLVFTRDPRCA